MKEFKEGDKIKIRILDADEMCVSGSFNNGDIVTVEMDSHGIFTSGWYGFEYPVWVEEGLFEIIEEESVEWNGEGYPPIGSLVEYQSYTGECRGPGKVFHVIEKTGNIFIEYEHGGWDNGNDLDRLRPVKTVRQKAIEGMQDAVRKHTGFGITVNAAEALYRAGYRKQPTEPVEDMNDPANWRKGDLVECVDPDETGYPEYFTRGKTYTLVRNNGSQAYKYTDDDEMWASDSGFRFHSRPESTGLSK